MLMRISLPGQDPHGGPLAAPGFGLQVQDQALLGTVPEASANISYTDMPVTYPDGSTVTTCTRPAYTLTEFLYRFAIGAICYPPGWLPG